MVTYCTQPLWLSSSSRLERPGTVGEGDGKTGTSSPNRSSRSSFIMKGISCVVFQALKKSKESLATIYACWMGAFVFVQTFETPCKARHLYDPHYFPTTRYSSAEVLGWEEAMKPGRRTPFFQKTRISDMVHVW